MQKIIFIIIITIFLLFMIYILMLMPRITQRPDMSMFRNSLFAHRGLHDNDEIMENSLEAFEAAIQYGYGIELDVQLSHDGQPVVTHDWTLDRCYNVNKRVSEVSYAVMKNLGVPHFKDVLELIDGQVPLIIELKAEWTDISVCETVVNFLSDYKGEYCIQSFNPLILIWLKNNHPDIIRGQLSMNFFKEKEKGNALIYFLVQNNLFNFLTKPDFIAYKAEYYNSFSLKLCKNLYKILIGGWTIKPIEVIEKYLDKFDFFIFEK